MFQLVSKLTKIKVSLIYMKTAILLKTAATKVNYVLFIERIKMKKTLLRELMLKKVEFTEMIMMARELIALQAMINKLKPVLSFN